MVSKIVRIYTDGSCSPNPGPGGWAAVLLFEGQDKSIELQGAAKSSTNNRMELTAALKALESLEEQSLVEIYTDSTYLQKGITQWLTGWQRNGWSTIDGNPVKNRDLWQSLSNLLQLHNVTWSWVKGHYNDTWNIRADELAMQARKQNQASYDYYRDGVKLFPGVTWKNTTGTGAWCVILNYNEHFKVIGETLSETTANRLYLIAIIEGVKALKRPLPVHIYTKSGYLRDGLGTWIEGWQKRGWVTRQGTEISNREQWQELCKLRKHFDIQVVPIDPDSPPCQMQEAKEIAREFEI
jgi:ribonuclease HI